MEFLGLICVFFTVSVNVDDSEAKKRKFPERAEPTVVEPGKEKNTKKATDDYHYDKFKKQFRRY